MFEQKLIHLRSRLEELGHKYGELHFNQCATIGQIADYEKGLGVSLPEQYREFILQIGDGVRIGEEKKLWLLPLFQENNTDCWESRENKLIVFPFKSQSTSCDETTPKAWYELTSHEKMQSDVGLCIGSTNTYISIVLALTGTQQGTAWFYHSWGWVIEPNGLPFFNALERMLDEMNQ